MSDLEHFLSNLTNTSDWPPRWYCGNWTDFHGWLYITADLMIWCAYFAIPVCIMYYVTKKSDNLRFLPVFWLFFSFILACGLTHLVDAMMFWWPAYRFNALVRIITAIISWVTVFSLIRIIPQTRKLRTEKELEQMVEERTSELYKTNVELLISAKQMQGKNRQLEEFANIASHNLRTPVANLQSLLDLYDIVPDKTEKQEMITKIKNQTDKLNKTLNTLIDAVKIRQDADVEKEQLCFETIFQRVKENMDALIDDAGAKITTDFSEAEHVVFNRQYLESIFLNLLSNAIKYRSDKQKLHVHFSSRKDADAVILKVKDNGLGLDMEKYGSKLFGLHKTFHNTHDAKGVGLYLVKNQVMAMGGHISVDSKPNEGMEFTITFSTYES